MTRKLSEFHLIEAFKRRIAPGLRGVIGVGDDADLIRWRDPEIMIATDVIVEGVDFVKSKSRAEWVGRKALAVNLSDMAAMGAEPVAFVASMGVPSSTDPRWCEQCFDGMMRLAQKYNVRCLGGDLSRARQIFISVTVMGTMRAQKPILRSTARAGDWLAVSGNLGGSIVQHHFQFEPRIKEARFLLTRFRPSSMIDISDGLLQDLSHLLKASHKGADLWLDRIPISGDAKRLAKKHPQKSLERALADGEDFELLFTVAEHQVDSLKAAWRKKFPRTPLSFIGLLNRQPNKIEFVSRRKEFQNLKMAKKGFTHF